MKLYTFAGYAKTLPGFETGEMPEKIQYWHDTAMQFAALLSQQGEQLRLPLAWWEMLRGLHRGGHGVDDLVQTLCELDSTAWLVLPMQISCPKLFAQVWASPRFSRPQDLDPGIVAQLIEIRQEEQPYLEKIVVSQADKLTVSKGEQEHER